MGGGDHLRKLVASSTKVTGSDLVGKVPGVDGYSWMHEAANISNIAYNLTIKNSMCSFVDFVYGKARVLARHAKHVLIVFDGNRLPGKLRTQGDVSQAIEETRGKIQELIDRTGVSPAVDLADTVGKAMIKQCRTLANYLPHDLCQTVFAKLQTISNVTLLFAPREADPQLVHMYRTGEIDFIVAEDGDYVTQQCATWTKAKFTPKTLTVSAVLFEPSQMLQFAADLSGKSKVDALALLSKSFQNYKEKSRAAASEQAFRLFALIHKHGLHVLMNYALLTKNDYANIAGSGPVTALTVLEEVGLGTLNDVVVSFVKHLHKEPSDEQIIGVARGFLQGWICFHHGIIVDRKGPQPRQRTLGGLGPKEAAQSRLCVYIGKMETNHDAVQQSMLGNCQFDRFVLQTIAPFRIDQEKLTVFDMNTMSSQQLQVQLAMRAVRVPKGKAQQLELMKAAKDYEEATGESMIIYPNMQYKNLPPPEGESKSGVEEDGGEQAFPTFLPDIGFTENHTQAALLCPQMPDAVAKHWNVGVHGNEKTFLGRLSLHRGMERAEKFMKARSDINGFAVCDGGDEHPGMWFARMRCPHSMGDNDPNKDQTHTYTGIQFRVDTVTISEEEVLCAQEVTTAGCNCPDGNSCRCWHVFALLYVMVNLLRPEASLIPQSSTAGSNAWNHPALRGICRVNKLLPAGRLPIANHSPNKGLERQRTRAAVPRERTATIQTGNGGRGADPPTLLMHGWADRNDAAVIAARAKLYNILRKKYGASCAAEELWPASPSKPDDYKEIPILSADYNLGYAEKFPEFLD
jgi:5'-3' exonuclease